MQKISFFIFFFLIVIFQFSCTRDVAPEITCEGISSYDTNIKAIIDTNCAYEGCHNGTPSAPGVFLDYDGLVPFLVGGSFEQRVVNIGDMPPDFALGPRMLTAEDLDLVICWIEEDFPEN